MFKTSEIDASDYILNVLILVERPILHLRLLSAPQEYVKMQNYFKILLLNIL